MTDNELREDTSELDELRDWLITWEHGDVPKGLPFEQWGCECFDDERVKELLALIKQHTDRARIDELGNVQLQHGHYVTQTFVDGEVITIEDRLNQLKESE